MDAATAERGLKLVKRLAWLRSNSLPPSVSLEDLVQEGFIGFMQAMTTYKDLGKATAETFAAYRIRGAMADYLRREDPLSRTARKTGGHVEFVAYDDDQHEGAEDPCAAAEFNQLLKSLIDAANQLSRREAWILRKLFIDGDTVTQIANELGTSKAYVSRVKTTMFEKLRVSVIV